MPIFSVSTLRTGFGDARTRVFSFSQRPASPAARFLASLVALVLVVAGLVLFLVLLIPAVAIALVVGTFAAISYTIRRALRNTTEPNGILDGRRNVRVVVRQGGEATPP